MKKLFLQLTFLLLSFFTQAQDLGRVRNYIDTLTSPYLHGRGYVCKGDSLAAVYLADRFKEYGLLSFNEKDTLPYFQFFDLNINTFPGTVQLCVDGKKLEAGKDYILDPASGGGNKKLRTLFLDSSFFSSEKKTAEVFEGKNR